MAAEFHHGDPLMVDYTPGTAVTAGDIVDIGSGTICVAHGDIAANELGAVGFPGGNAVYRITLATAAAFAVGATVNVDPSTNEASAGGPNFFGRAVGRAVDQATGDVFVYAAHMSDPGT